MISHEEWEFLFEFLQIPKEGKLLLLMLAENPFDRAQRAVTADWFEENGNDQAARLTRKGFTLGGQRGDDITQPVCPPSGGIIVSGLNWSAGSIVSSSIASGQIGTSQFASGSLSINQTRHVGSAYEDFHS